MTELIVAVTLTVSLSALCSLFEAVLYSVPHSHVEAMAGSGNAAGQILQRLRANVDQPIAAILSLNTIANTAGAAVAGAAAGNLFGHTWLIYFSAALTLVILLFSEVLPKTAGVVYSRPLAVLIARPLQVLVWLMSPLVWLCRLTTRTISAGHTVHSISEDELIVTARLGLESGVIDADELAVIQNVLELGNKPAHQVMTPRTVMVAADYRTPLHEACRKDEILRHSRIPVYDESPDDVIGVVHRRDLLAHRARETADTEIGALMQPVRFVPETTPLDRLLRMFLRRHEHLFVVLDEHGGVSGVITLEDVLEEILGKEIVDEFDDVADLRDLARRRRADLILGSADDSPE